MTMEKDFSSVHKFLVVGIITSEDFQKSKYSVTKLHKSFPQDFDSPDIRPMMDVEWNQFITKHRRKLGNGLWSIKNRVVIFKNKEFLGDYGDLNEFIWGKWKCIFHQDWQLLATQDVIDFLEEKTGLCRQLVYLTIAIDCRVIGSLLFELYNDLVPLASENFMKRCTNPLEGYEGTLIHRVVKNSWIQCGGHDLEPVPMPCENYVVPHDRRGLLSTCNNGAHKDNSTQFFISLDSTPWMNYKYVAFGQLLQGDEVLKAIQEVPTYYQAPTRDIRIVKCGEYKCKMEPEGTDLVYTADQIDQWTEVQNNQIDILTYLKSYQLPPLSGEGAKANDPYVPPALPPLQPNASCNSILSESKIQKGIYSLKSDLKTHAPFTLLPELNSVIDEGAEDFGLCGPDYPITKYKNQLFDDTLSPGSSDITM